jgi:hypothetical protein
MSAEWTDSLDLDATPTRSPWWGRVQARLEMEVRVAKLHTGKGRTRRMLPALSALRKLSESDTGR